MNTKEFVVEQMGMVRGMLTEWIKDISEEKMTVRAVDGGVHLAWILGHGGYPYNASYPYIL